MEKSIADIEESVKKLRKNLDDTSKFKAKLELNRSDLMHFMKMAEQNMKYLKKNNTVSLVTEYNKVVKSHKSAMRQIEELEKQIYVIGQSIERLTKRLTEQMKMLEAFKKAAEPKILPFKRRSS